jgi:hypothetical protein
MAGVESLSWRELLSPDDDAELHRKFEEARRRKEPRPGSPMPPNLFYGTPEESQVASELEAKSLAALASSP